MEDEIDVAKANIRTIVTKTKDFATAPSVRLGLVAYRGEDDKERFQFEIHDFTENATEFEDIVDNLKAQGGMGSELIVEGMKHALNLTWKYANKLIFQMGI